MSPQTPTQTASTPSAGSTARGANGQYLATTPRDVLYDLIKEVALIAAGGDVDLAKDVSMSEWDAARSSATGVGPMTASAVKRSIGMTWPDCVHVGLLSPTKRAVAEAARLSGEGRPVTDALIARALQAAAHRLKRTPQPDSYDEMIEEIESAREARFGEDLGLPSARTVLNRYGSWDEACTAAGLTPPPKHVRLPVPKPHEVYLDCMAEHGCAPSREWFAKWCKITGRQLGHHRHKEMIAKAREEWAARGEEWPDACPRKFPLPEPDPNLESERNRWGYWTDELILDALRRYIAEADAAGAKITQRHYRKLATHRKDLDLPAASQLSKKGDLADLMKLARSGATEIPPKP